jgi:SAM-dependent methyltransferase
MLYTQLAGVYDEIYQTLFDYDKEFATYAAFLSKYKAQSIVEIGCGTGHLAKRFMAHGFDYCGLDLNQEMLDIAAQNTQNTDGTSRSNREGAYFQQADMRDFSLPKTYDAVLITGRTISYLLSNPDILACFQSIKRCLKPDGVLIFDAIDAVPLFNFFDTVAQSSLETVFGQNAYKRTSICKPNLATGWTWDWASVYFQKKEGEYVEIGRDFATLRSFTKDEMTLLLTMSGFTLLDIVDKEAYTWQDAFYVCQKT